MIFYRIKHLKSAILSEPVKNTLQKPIMILRYRDWLNTKMTTAETLI